MSHYNSFGVLDFDASSLVGQSVTAAELLITDSSYSSSKTTNVTVWSVTDTTTSLAQGQTTIKYDTSGTDGYSGQLGTGTQLGSYMFTKSSPPGPLIVIDLTTNLSALTTLINSGNHDIRLVFLSDQLGYATYAGAGTGTAAAPQLSLKTQVPEPCSMIAIGLGIAGFVAKRRRA